MRFREKAREKQRQAANKQRRRQREEETAQKDAAAAKQEQQQQRQPARAPANAPGARLPAAKRRQLEQRQVRRVGCAARQESFIWTRTSPPPCCPQELAELEEDYALLRKLKRGKISEVSAAAQRRALLATARPNLIAPLVHPSARL